MKKRMIPVIALLAMAAITLLVHGADKKPVTITGYVIDSACTYVKNLEKPVSADCATACAKGGSPLVILTKAGKIYLPIDEAVPAKGQNEKLLPYAGRQVEVTGKTFTRGGSNAIVIESITAAKTT